jgi:hypothetical protein
MLCVALRDTRQADKSIRTVVEHCSFEAAPIVPVDPASLPLLAKS